MDTTDVAITFDSEGVCHHCHRANDLLGYCQSSQSSPEDWARRLKSDSVRSEPVAVIGLSGGLDSSYLALMVHRLGIRPLAVHIDAGWNNPASVRNIRAIVQAFGLRLETVVVDWSEMKRLQLAFLGSGIRNQDIPQDHAFFSILYKRAAYHGIRHVLTGSNLSTESILPASWGSDAMDGRFLMSVARRHGLQGLSTIPVTRLPTHYLKRMMLGRMVIHKPLDLIPYKQNEAKQELMSLIGWHDYGGKHRESMFTTWFQHVYLPRRFGIDKRRAHLSSLIASGQSTRDEALEILRKPELNEVEERVISRQIARKLGISISDLEALTLMPSIDETVFRNDQWIYSPRLIKIGRTLLSNENRVLRGVAVPDLA